MPFDHPLLLRKQSAQLPFRQVIGVEMSQPLCDAARENVAGAKHLRCPDVQVVNADAKEYTPPDDVSVVFLFNPFTGHMLDAVLDNLRQSWTRRPRELTVLYVLPVRAHDVFGQEAWLVKQHERFSQGLRLIVYKSKGVSQREVSA